MFLGNDCSDIRLVFDRYETNSLKARTRRKRTSGNEIKYKISDEGKIANITLKQLLSHVDTKKDLTAYLAQKTIKALKETNKRYSILLT